MIETILDYEEVIEVVEEEIEKRVKWGIEKLALMKDMDIIALFDVNEDIENIESKAIELVKDTLQFDSIDLCYIQIDRISEKIVYRNIIQHDIIKEKYENYQKINDHIYTLNTEELKTELLSYAKDIFNEILDTDDLYLECKSDSILYDDCVYLIFTELENDYNNGFIIYTSESSFVLYGSYEDVKTTKFCNSHYLLSQDTKIFLIDEINCSDLLEETKKEIIKNIKKY